MKHTDAIRKHLSPDKLDLIEIEIAASLDAIDTEHAELLAALAQYRDDLRHPDMSDNSRQRRLELVNLILSRVQRRLELVNLILSRVQS